ncbi:hypothetical protein LguiA_004430 [Lonicera macranthoides]
MGSFPIFTKSYFPTFLLLLVISTLTISQNVAALKDCNFPAIYNFGDSNSDTGAFSAVILWLPLPYGETYFRAQSGRVSDGRLITDFLANNLGLPFLSAYVDSIGANFTYGANFAVAGSSILPLAQPLPAGFLPIYLPIQLSEFSQFINRSQMIRSQGGVFESLLPTAETFSKALYTIDIGQNDLGAAILNGSTVEQINAMVPSLINTTSLQVEALYRAGARSFWIHNTGPIGCLAFILSGVMITPDQKDNAGCARQFNGVAQYFNSRLKEQVVLLRERLPLAAITYVDIYSIKYSFFSQPQQYGFVQPLRVCCGSGGIYNYNRSILCGTVQSCSNPSQKVVWDGVHYTEAANRAVFEQILTGKFIDPPLKPRFACHRSL